MPNWCGNALEVSGDKETLKKMLKKVRGKQGGDIMYDLDFEKIIPTPKALKNTTAPSDSKDPKVIARKKKYGYENWYDFHVNEWGTKWNAGDVELTGDIKDKRIMFRFSTAWCEPHGIVERLSEMFPTLKFDLSYDEEGNDHVGRKIFRSGELVSETRTRLIN